MKEIYDDIVTPRLLLRLISAEAVRACLNNDIGSAERILGVSITEDISAHLSGFRYGQKQLKTDPLYQRWSARAIVLSDQMTMIGLIRFHSRPDPEYIYEYGRDAAELGYRIFAAYRQRGYATEAVKAIMDWAQQEFGTSRFLASVSPDNIPSLRLVSHFGFKKVDEIMDDIDGIEQVFLRIADKK
ncbi:GNAT family N-acetyltransferase [Pedobacter lusitanus]|uniref:GNAT family N-acetyltransferase n=1 Tax=Pedobacter lusitanus TaxID=1503925 RepID=UPI000695C014|nr:GNAT family N-acetyltransferase [Pedobacter lusitanus]